MKLEFAVRYKLAPGEPEHPHDDRWRDWTPTPRNWDEAGEMVKQLGARLGPVLVTIVCTDADA